MDNQIVVSDYAQMDRVLREERAYILNLVKQIKKAGCNVLLIQKSILRYAGSEGHEKNTLCYAFQSSSVTLTTDCHVTEMLLVTSPCTSSTK